MNKLDEKCEYIRKEILNSVSKNGGHLSSNLGIVEIIVSLFEVFDFPNDKLIFDVTHQCYAYKLLTGRSLNNLRQDDGTSGLSNRKESIYDCIDAGHSSTSLSYALGLGYARELSKEKYEIISIVGDGSFGNGMIYEAINSILSTNQKHIIIINDNNMSITKTLLFTNELLNNGSLKNIFNNDKCEYIENIDGHNIDQLVQAFKHAKESNKSTIMHIKTKKGKGYVYAENDHIGSYHKVNPFSLETGIISNKNDKLLCTNAVDWLLENIENDALVFNPATALASSLYPLMNKLSNQFVDAGMAEENCVAMASSFGLKHHSYVFINSTFSQRSYDQFLHDIARLDSHTTVLIDKVGFMGQDGPTHQGIYDLSFLNSIPNIMIVTPSNKAQLYEYLTFSKTFNHPLFIRLCAEPIVEIDNSNTTKINNNICIISYGNQINKIKSLYSNNIFEIKCQKPIDDNILKQTLKFDKIIIYDSYSTSTGFSQIIKSKLMDLNYKGIVKSIEIPDTFIDFNSIKVQQEKTHTTLQDLSNEVNK